jgi:predicted XRE-type DNA-binding protein
MSMNDFRRLAAKMDQHMQQLSAQGINDAQAADVLGIPQPKLSKMLRGQFCGISEAKMLDCLVRLGRNVQIVVGPARRAASSGRIAVVFSV